MTYGSLTIGSQGMTMTSGLAQGLQTRHPLSFEATEESFQLLTV